MIQDAIIQELKESKNLLAFSAGVDSTALFFLLLEQNIQFDIAIVNYNLRKEAKEEIAYAKELASKYNKEIFIAEAPKFKSNFEANARDFRYTFFQQIIQKHNYSTLLMAHQLNDNLEWLLMRLSQGSGIEAISAMAPIEQKKDYKLIRPLLHITKDELVSYLETKQIKYFIDSSNLDTKYLRNRFRPIALELLKESKSGFIKSFSILQNEKKLLQKNFKIVFSQKQLRVYYIKSRDYFSYALAYALKELGYLLSGKERQNLTNSMVVGRKWAVEYSSSLLFIAPYIKIKMDKRAKEQFRTQKIPPKIRGYLYKEEIVLPKFDFDEDQA